MLNSGKKNSRQKKIINMDVRKCIIKTRMVTRTYTLQADRHKFNRYEVEPLCQLCNIESEDLPHILTTCVAFVDIRNALYISIKHKDPI
jgi:hypothetical protein